MEELVLVGFGGHAKSVVDSIEETGIYHIAGYTDPEERCAYHGYRCLGTDEALPDLFKDGIQKAFICVGFLGKGNIRNQLYNRIKEIGYQIPIIIDPSAIVSETAQIGEGAYIGKRAVLNAGAQIGNMAIVNTGAIIEHESRVGAFSHIAVGAVLCGNVSVGDNCLVGAGTTVIQEVWIGDGTVIGAGSVVLGNVKKGCIAYGVVKGTGV